MQTPLNEFVFTINRNQYTLRWDKGCSSDMRYILLNYFVDYIKSSWSTSDIYIKASRFLGCCCEFVKSNQF